MARELEAIRTSFTWSLCSVINIVMIVLMVKHVDLHRRIIFVREK